MARNITVEADRFAMALDEIVRGVDEGVAKRMPECVTKACRKGKDATKRAAPVSTGAYRKGFSYRVRKSDGGRDVSGEIGNKDLPGLVHLLEKGHATIGGGRVQGYPHVSVGADEAFAVLEESIGKAVDEALS